MSLPATRAEFKEFILRRLGKPVIEINVDDDQVEDRIDEALSFYWDYHFDGTELLYLQHQLTANDIAEGYITIPENIIGVVEIFDIGSSLNTNNLFNIQYQFALNDMYSLTFPSIVPYFQARQHIRLYEDILVGKQPIRYNRHRNRLYIDTNMDRFNVGEYIVLRCYEVVNPATYTDVWKDRWLIEYASALVKRQWGTNLTKFEGMQLPGGVTFNGRQIYDDAQQTIDKMREEMIVSYSPLNVDFIG